MKLTKILLMIIVISMPTTATASPFGYTLDLIYGEGYTRGIKVAYHYHSSFLRRYFDQLDVFLETSINFWEYGEKNEYDTNFVLSVSPILHYPIMELSGQQIFLEFGIGASILDDTRFAGNDVSTNYQFEDRIGILTRFGKHSLGLRLLHYSNAGIKQPNPGLDFISFSYARRF